MGYHKCFRHSEELDEPSSGGSSGSAVDLAGEERDGRLNRLGNGGEALCLVAEAGEDEVLDAGLVGRRVGVDGEVVEGVVDGQVARELDGPGLGEVPLLVESIRRCVRLLRLERLVVRHVAAERVRAGGTDAGAGRVGDWARTVKESRERCKRQSAAASLLARVRSGTYAEPVQLPKYSVASASETPSRVATVMPYVRSPSVGPQVKLYALGSVPLVEGTVVGAPAAAVTLLRRECGSVTGCQHYLASCFVTGDDEPSLRTHVAEAAELTSVDEADEAADEIAVVDAADAAVVAAPAVPTAPTADADEAPAASRHADEMPAWIWVGDEY